MGLVVSVGGQKGGCGKSTIATGLAVEASRDTKKLVLLADMDTRQQTSFEWAERRRALGIEPKVNAQVLHSPAGLKPLRGVRDLIVVDMPPWADVETVAVARMSDLFIAVTAPNNFELNPTVMLMREFERVGVPRRQTVIALSKVLDTRDEAMARDYLRQEGLTALDVPLRFFPSTMRVGNEGRAVTEIASKVVADQGRLFFKGVFRVLERVRGRDMDIEHQKGGRGREREL
jgi:chromosome partitioning protein